MLHVMVDLETWATSPAAVPISIGAVKFDPAHRWEDQQPLDQFHVGIAPKSAQMVGLHVEADTLDFWMDPKQAAALAVWRAMPKVTIQEAVEGFVHWYGEEDLPMWANGANFDPVILDTAFKVAQTGQTRPWKYNSARCFRTIRRLLPPEWKPLGEFNRDSILVKHTALDDARWQTFELLAVAAELGLHLR